MIADLLQEIGVSEHKARDGRISIPQDLALESAVQQLMDCTDLLGIDLTTISGFPEDRLQAAQSWQCKLIRQLRAEAYKLEADGMFFGSEADGDAKQAWLDKRAEIKARYPYPGSYR